MSPAQIQLSKIFVFTCNCDFGVGSTITLSYLLQLQNGFYLVMWESIYKLLRLLWWLFIK